MAKALTRIKHGDKTFEPGDDLKKSDFSDEEYQALEDAGAIGSAKDLKEQENPQEEGGS